MTNLFRILTLLGLLCSGAFATDKIQTVLVSLPVLHPWDESGVKFAKVPFTGWDIDNAFYKCSFYSKPRIVFEDTKHLRHDVNLISAYKITVDSDIHDDVTVITIRTGSAVTPEGHILTVDEVVELAVKSVRADFPDEGKFVIKVSDKPLKTQ